MRSPLTSIAAIGTDNFGHMVDGDCDMIKTTFCQLADNYFQNRQIANGNQWFWQTNGLRLQSRAFSAG